MLIDTHCHLTDKRFDESIDDLLKKAREAGVGKIIAPGTSLNDSKRVVELAEKYESVYGLVGIHPENVEEIVDIKYQITELREMIESSNKVVGVGEIGLDFHYDKEKKTKRKQVELFERQLKLAVDFNLPVMIHAREAEKEMREVLQKFKQLPRGQFHCFGESEDFLDYVLGEGFYVSFCGNVTYKDKRSLPKTDPTSEEPASNAVTQATGSAKGGQASEERSSLRDLLKLVPLDRLLLETDSPYLSPEPKRRKTNEPKNVRIIALFIANILGIGIDSLINQTEKNSLCLYSLGK